VRCIDLRAGTAKAAPSSLPPNASLVAGGVASLPLADTSTDVIITAEPLLDLLSNATGPFLAELNRVLSPSGIWLIAATASAAAEYRTHGFGPLATSDQPCPAVAAQVASLFRFTYVASGEALERVLGLGEPPMEAPTVASPSRRQRPARVSASSRDLTLLIHARTRLRWLESLPDGDGRSAWMLTCRAGAVEGGRSRLAELDAALARVSAELDRPLYRWARAVRKTVDRVPLVLPTLRLMLRARSALRRRPTMAEEVELSLAPAVPVNAYPLRTRWMDPVQPTGEVPWPTQLVLTTREPWMDGVRPLVSIVVLSFNNGALTAECLRHIWAHTEGVPYEVIVVDNGSHPSETAPLRPLQDQFRALFLSVNRFFGEGNNIGAEAARGDIILFLNNDVLVSEGWLAPLLTAMGRPDVGAAGARLMFADGRVQETGASLRSDGSSVQFEKGMEAKDVPVDGEVDVDYCSAACLAIRTDLFRRVGGFDLCWEPAYYEDVDLCFKVRALGFRVVCARDSRVVHLEHATTARKFVDLDLRGQPEFNQVKFLDRWGPVLRGEKPVTDYAALAVLEVPGRG
jgi:GT2 family glycosyltransferase